MSTESRLKDLGLHPRQIEVVLEGHRKELAGRLIAHFGWAPLFGACGDGGRQAAELISSGIIKELSL